MNVLHDPPANKGTAFSLEERERFGLTGLPPPRVEDIAEQVTRVLASVRARSTPLENHCALAALRNENETLSFRALTDNLAELVPIVYAPTVRQACANRAESTNPRAGCT